MSRYLLQLNKWDLEAIIEADSLPEAKALYMEKFHINGTVKSRWTLMEETEREVIEKQELVIMAMQEGIPNAATMTMLELFHALKFDDEKEEEESEEE